MEFLRALGTRDLYLTFYPAVMIASLYGGLRAGLVATALSGACALYWEAERVGPLSATYPADWLGMVIFIMCCTIISCLSEAVHRARLRAKEAEAQAGLSAERELAAAAFRDSQERLHLALEAGRAGTWYRDISANKSVWDDYTHELFGLAPGTFSGEPADFFGRIHPDDRERVRAENTAALEGAADYSTTYRVVWPDSSVHFVSARGRLHYDSSGRAVRMVGINWDITELHAAQEALRESEERLRLTLETTNDGIWDWNISTGGAVLSPRWYTMLGYEPYEFPQSYNAFRSLIHADDAGRAEREINECTARGQRFAVEIRMRTKSGGWRWILTRGGVVERNADGTPARMVGTHSDVTELKLAVEKLRDSETMFRNMFERHTAVKLIIDPDTGCIIDANEAAERFYGWSRERLGKMRIQDINTLSPEEIKLKMKKARTFRCDHFEFRHRRADGSTRDVDVFSSKIVIKGKDLLYSIVHDVTERKQAEKSLQLSEDRYRRLFEDAVLGIFRSTTDGKMIDVNPAFARMFGFDSPEEAKSQVNDVAVDLYADPSPRDEIIRMILEAREPIHAENLYKRKDGSIFTGNLHAWVVRGRDGKDRYVEGFIEDITERKRAEEEKERLEAQLRQAQRLEAIGTLAGGIAHDFNNILAPIIGYTEMALNDIPQNNSMRFGQEQILTAALRARDLVKQILAFGRSGRDQQQEPVEISSIIKEALKLLRASLPSSIEIVQNIESGTACADPTQIHQVLVNLCTNAAHAMDDKGILEVELSRVELSESDLADQSILDLKPGPHLKLCVSDTGIGMDKATLERIFDPYFTTKEVGKGSGLGLAVVNGIVKQHHGAIAVRSEPEKGSVFSIYIPETEMNATEIFETAQAPLEGTERILLVDDEQLVLEMGEAILGRLGYRITAETDSLHAYEVFRASPTEFDLVITDCTMPHLTGLDLVPAMRKIRPHMPIILCTGLSHKLTEDILNELGLELLRKPYSIRQLSEAVRRVLDMQKEN
jgi:PAS domain S-box-containing protein